MMAYQWKNQKGDVIIKESVVKKIAAVSAMECYGMAGFCVKNSNGEAKLLHGKKSVARGIEIDTSENKLEIGLSIAVVYGADIKLVCKTIMKTVRRYIEQLTGFRVGRIYINVEGIAQMQVTS